MFLVTMIFVTDLFFSLTRSRYFKLYTPMIQSILHRPGAGGTYAQNLQDDWVARLAVHNGWVDEGFFLDVGAYSGLWCSNSKLLEERFGWEGLCVEPFPQDMRGRGCKVVERVIGSEDDKPVVISGSGQLRTVNIFAGPPTTGSTSILMTTFPTLLKSNNVPKFINFISLDVEGQELPSLLTFPFEEYEVGAWIIENGSRKRGGEAIVNLLRSNGYRFRDVENAGVDGYYVKDKFWMKDLLKKASREHPPGSWSC